MTRTLSIILLFTAVSQTNVAAKEPAAPIEHEPTLYVDAKSRVFTNLKLPVFLRVASSPDAGALSVPLRLANVAEGANPMYLDGPGRHTIRHNDFLHEVPDDAIIYYINADGAPPKTEIIFNRTPRHQAGPTVFYGEGLQVSVTSTDDLAGVKETYVSLDGAEFVSYQDALSFTAEGSYNLRLYAVDNVGNSSKPTRREFTVDLSPPATVSTVHGLHKKNILSPLATIKLSSADTASGLRTVQYNFDADLSKKAYVLKASRLHLAKMPEGEHTLNFSAVDKVQNREEAGSYTFYLDRTPPTLTAAIAGDQFEDDRDLFVSARSKVNLEATDAKLPGVSIRYGIDGAKKTAYGKPFNFPERSGSHTVRYDASDELRNTTKLKSLSAYVDLDSPRTRAAFVGPRFLSRHNILYVADTAKLVLRSSDKESGVEKTSYSINGRELSTYTEPVGFSEEDRHEASFFATDRVNNQEETRSVTFVVDGSGPVISHHFSTTPEGPAIASNAHASRVKADSGGSYARHTYLYLAATDQLSGVHNIACAVNDEAPVEYRSPVTFTRAGEYIVRVVATDKVGKSSEQTIRFTIK